MPHVSAHTLPPLPERSHVAADEPVGIGLAVAGVAVPALLAYNVPPSATFFNQAAAVFGWGLLLAWFASATRGTAVARRGGVAALLAALAIVSVTAFAAMQWASLPHGLALSAAASVAMAMLAALIGAAVVEAGHGATAWRALCWAFVVAGLLSGVVGVIQVFMPEWSEGGLIAASATGRASGNLRQPNHLSSLLLWSVIGTVYLIETGRLGWRLGAAFVLAFTFVLVLTASRTGVVGVGVLALWGLLDRRLSRPARVMLVLMPLAYFMFWTGLGAWAPGFSGEGRITDTSDSPNSRRHIWANTLALIARHPWAGVGFGDFNFAWSLTPFPGRPTAFFDHTHNLPLQLAVELGVPLSMLVLALLTYALWRALRAGLTPAAPVPMLRAAAMAVLMIALHSLFEYPLWYSYFLLPTAFVWGLCLGADRTAQSARTDASKGGRGAAALVIAAALMAAGGALSVWDYHRVAVIFAPGEQAAPLAARIAEGERSWFFEHHAHYAAATIAEHPSQALPSFAVATHYLLDTRLMMAWARALNEAGDVERARYLAQRLREFRNPDSADFFAVCDAPLAGSPLPFQCTPPAREFSYRDFR
jgi:O-antigen ligase